MPSRLSRWTLLRCLLGLHRPAYSSIHYGEHTIHLWACTDCGRAT